MINLSAATDAFAQKIPGPVPDIAVRDKHARGASAATPARPALAGRGKPAT